MRPAERAAPLAGAGIAAQYLKEREDEFAKACNQRQLLERYRSHLTSGNGTSAGGGDGGASMGRPDSVASYSAALAALQKGLRLK